MRIRHIISALTLLALTSTASAGFIQVNLKEGTVKPGETIVITLDELRPTITYVLACNLSSDHTSGKSFDVVKVTTPTSSTKIGLSAEETPPGSHQYKLPTNKNTYLYGNITKDIGDISITNLDNTDSVVLSSCHAVGRV